MTGKTQKAKNVLEDFKKRVEITEEEKRKVMDEAIIEVHAENSEFLEKVNMPIKVPFSFSFLPLLDMQLLSQQVFVPSFYQ